MGAATLPMTERNSRFVRLYSSSGMLVTEKRKSRCRSAVAAPISVGRALDMVATTLRPRVSDHHEAVRESQESYTHSLVREVNSPISVGNTPLAVPHS